MTTETLEQYRLDCNCQNEAPTALGLAAWLARPYLERAACALLGHRPENTRGGHPVYTYCGRCGGRLA